MRKFLSVALVLSMLFSLMLVIIPASAADDETEVVTFFPNNSFDSVKKAFEASDSNTSDYVPSVTPFAFTNYDVTKKLSESKLLSISIPVNVTKDVDSDGNFIFTLLLFKNDGLVGSDPVNTYKVKINAKEHGLEANKQKIRKVVKVDLRSYNITIGKNQVLAFAASDDTLLPAWTADKNSTVYKAIAAAYPESNGFAANIGKKNYAPNGDAFIFFDFELEKNVGWDVVVPVEDDIDFTYYDTRTFMDDDVYADLVALYEKDGAGTLDYVPGVAPFTPVNVQFQNRFAGTRLRTIFLPVNKVTGVNSDGDAIFTISTFKRNGLTGSAAVKSWKIKINPKNHGINVGNKIFKFIEVDLSSYNIVVAEDEVLAFSGAGDTLLPGYSGNIVAFLQGRCPEMMGFGACTGTPQFASNTWASACIFFNIVYDVPVIKEYAELRDLIAEVDEYEKEDYTSGWEDFELTLTLAKKAIKESPDDAETLGGIAEDLRGAIDELVALDTVNLTVLEEALNAAETVAAKQDDYTPATWANFVEALNAAKAVKAEKSPKQSAVNKAAKNLSDAQAALELKPDFTALDSEIARAEALKESDYISSTWASFKEALTLAKAIKANVNATATEVENALNGLKATIDSLDKKTDNSALQAKIDKTVDEIDSDLYTAVTYKKVTEALRKAKTAIENGEVGEKSSEALIKEIDNAIAGLKKRADMNVLKKLVEEWENVTDADYHPDGIPALKKAVDAILTATKPTNASNTSEDDAAELIEALNAAIAALKKYADYTEIDAELAKIQNLDQSIYTEESWNKLVEVMNNINELKSNRNTTMDESDKALGDLKSAIEGLEKKDTGPQTEPGETSADNTDTEKKGCGSTIGVGIIVVVATAVLGSAVVLKKKD